MLTLERYRARNSVFTELIADTFSTRDRLRDMKGEADLLIPQSDLAMLETEKMYKGSKDLGDRVKQMSKDGVAIRGEVRYIGDEIEGG